MSESKPERREAARRSERPKGASVAIKSAKSQDFAAHCFGMSHPIKPEASEASRGSERPKVASVAISEACVAGRGLRAPEGCESIRPSTKCWVSTRASRYSGWRGSEAPKRPSASIPHEYRALLDASRARPKVERGEAAKQPNATIDQMRSILVERAPA